MTIVKDATITVEDGGFFLLLDPAVIIPVTVGRPEMHCLLGITMS